MRRYASATNPGFSQRAFRSPQTRRPDYAINQRPRLRDTRKMHSLYFVLKTDAQTGSVHKVAEFYAPADKVYKPFELRALAKEHGGSYVRRIRDIFCQF